jgi:hypothetical protein
MSEAVQNASPWDDGAPAHERVIKTLRSWNIHIDEALFLGGMDKGSPGAPGGLSAQ